MNIEKVGTYFFILGVLIAILSGAFPINADMQVIVLLLLIITGAFTGLLNIEEEREIHFLIAAIAFILASTVIKDYLLGLELIESFSKILSNLVVFSATASIVVGLKLIFQYASLREERTYEEELVFDDPKKESTWNMIIFIGVCLSFIIFILEAFFYTKGLTQIISYLSWAIIAVFLVDLIILFIRSEKSWSFFRYHWADIIAVIPFIEVFQLAKVLRITRIARFAGKTSKLSRIGKISHSSKFFSNNSGFNQYLKKKDK